MKGTPDLERSLAKIYKFSVEAESRAIYINLNSVHKQNEFYTLLTELDSIVEKLDIVFGKTSKISAKRLNKLVRFEDKKTSK